MLKTGHYILSGEINSGKTSKLFDQLKVWSQDGVNVSGWLSLPVIQDGVKRGYDLAFVSKSKIINKIKLIRDFKFEGSTKWRRFWLDESVFQKAGMADLEPCDIFIIDEVGPLELEDKKGFWPLLPYIYDTHKTTVTVVRNSCLKQFMAIFPKMLMHLTPPVE